MTLSIGSEDGRKEFHSTLGKFCTEYGLRLEENPNLFTDSHAYKAYRLINPRYDSHSPKGVEDARVNCPQESTGRIVAFAYCDKIVDPLCILMEEISKKFDIRGLVRFMHERLPGGETPALEF